MQLESIEQKEVQSKSVFQVDQMQLQYHYEHINLEYENLKIKKPNLNEK